MSSKPTIKSLQAENALLKERIAELEAGLAKPHIKLTPELINKASTKMAERNEQYRLNRNKIRAIERSKLPAKPVNVPAKPPVLREMMMTDVLQPPANKTQWMMTYTNSWEGLEDSSRKTYISGARNAFDFCGLKPSKDLKTPEELTQFALAYEPPIDIWKLVERCSLLEKSDGEKSSIHLPNLRSKSLFGIFNATLRSMEDGDPDEKRLGLWCLVLRNFNGWATKTSTLNHLKQQQSEVALRNTVPWDEWQPKAREYVLKYNGSKVFAELLNSVIIAVYSMIPPIRLDWCSVEIIKRAPPKSDERNTIVFGDGGKIDVYWGQFKNKKSYKDELPLHHSIENAELRAVLLAYKKQLNSNWLFPVTNDNRSPHIPQAKFGYLLGSIAEEISGKRFTVTRMRSSFITNFHSKLADSGKGADLKTLEDIMKQLHQKNIAIHLGYNKQANEEKWRTGVLKKITKEILNEID